MCTDYLKCIGMDFVTESDESLEGFFCYIASEGKPVPTYGSDHVDFRKKTGYPEFIITTIRNNEKEGLSFSNFYTHCSGPKKWTFQVMETLVNNPRRGERQILASPSGNESMCIVNIAQPDIIPSYFKGENVDLQLVAFAYDIKYYKDEDEYNNAESYECRGKKFCNAIGAVLPIMFMNNHHESGEHNETDDLVSISGKVLSVQKGMINLGGEEYFAFIDCYIETFFGKLEIVHTLEQINELQHNNIKPGSIVSGLFVLSGDPMLGEYSEGAVFDKENIMRYIGTVISEKEIQSDNLVKYLSDDCIFYSDVTGTEKIGRDEVINHIDYVKNTRKNPYRINAATIEFSEDDMDYKPGERCLILTEPTTDEPESILFVDFDEDAKASRLFFCNDSRYKFRFDYNIPENNLSEDN